MSKEIVDAVKALEQEKGISSDKLMDALEDALLSAYKKTPGAAKYARVDLDHETGDFRAFELILPPELEEKLLAEAAEARRREREIDPETGELRELEEPELDPEMIAPYEDQIRPRDVTPEDFGRIAAQTAKQVILQRIREAERQMMYDEYQDRVGELITGIIQQSDKRYTLVQLRERVEALLPKSEQVYNERYDHGMRVKAVITDVSDSTKGPSYCRLSPQSRADQEPLRVGGPRRSPTDWSRSSASPASPATAGRSRSSPTPTGSTRSAPASARAAHACGWWSRSCAARRSTSFPTTTSPPASSPRRFRPHGCAR